MTTVAYLAVRPKVAPTPVGCWARHAGTTCRASPRDPCRRCPRLGADRPLPARSPTQVERCPGTLPSRRFGVGIVTRAVTADDIPGSPRTYAGEPPPPSTRLRCDRGPPGHQLPASARSSAQADRGPMPGRSLDARAPVPPPGVAAVRDGAGPGVAVTAKSTWPTVSPRADARKHRGGTECSRPMDTRSLELTGGSSLPTRLPLPWERPPRSSRHRFHSPSGSGSRCRESASEGVPVRGGLLPRPGRLSRGPRPAADPCWAASTAGPGRVALAGVLVRRHAEALRASRTWVARWERGDRDPASASTATGACRRSTREPLASRPDRCPPAERHRVRGASPGRGLAQTDAGSSTRNSSTSVPQRSGLAVGRRF